MCGRFAVFRKSEEIKNSPSFTRRLAPSQEIF
jgi:putative SOS response-associated peptidase YedK